ncbi:metallophosphoesterase [Stieleria varia]|uniref:Putative metallophosphoesterase n=1 Tax=Stieleria varia TaxID=2528005 RepID=A0A5C6AYQ1_9BACT|nr:metallophosphoesterase [Stieleria varia]TWU04597.1 putative metallophosphoesterase [Stieleria varia]
MSALSWWIVWLVALIGHAGLHIGIYNRINGFGWPRVVIKSIVKFFLLTTIAIPILFCVFQGQVILDLLIHGGTWSSLSLWARGYVTLCCIIWLVLGIPWLMWRPIFRLEWVDAPRKIEVVDVQVAVRRPLALSGKAKLESKLPLNQLLELSIEEISLPVVGLPDELVGYRIAHVSDVHLTGDIHPDFVKHAMQRATLWKPDLIALTGDIIDKQPCIDWLVDIFHPANAHDGCYYILGNHDTRVVDSRQTRDAMDRAGWIDLGSQAVRRMIGGIPVSLIGNEFPWFERPDLPPPDDSFRLLLSHSPDQLGWARRNAVGLMLAGHTHGGQGRLPLIGPILSPSFHGSRYASGDFYKPPTTLHVTRGLGGVHLMRINCRPELSLLTLSQAKVHQAF